MVDNEIDGASAIVDVEDLLPGLAAVRSFEDPALSVGRGEMAKGRDPDGVGPRRMDDNASDVLSILEAHVLPDLSGVDGLVHAIAPVGAAGGRVVAGSGPDDVFVR